MTKHYCDCCGKDLTEAPDLDADQFEIRLDCGASHFAQFKLRMDSHGYELCRNCVLDGLRKLDPREQPTTSSP